MLWDKVRLLYQQLEIHICGMFQPLTTQFDFPEFLLGNKPQDHLFDIFPVFYGAIFKPVDKTHGLLLLKTGMIAHRGLRFCIIAIQL